MSPIQTKSKTSSMAWLNISPAFQEKPTPPISRPSPILPTYWGRSPAPQQLPNLPMPTASKSKGSATSIIQTRWPSPNVPFAKFLRRGNASASALLRCCSMNTKTPRFCRRSYLRISLPSIRFLPSETQTNPSMAGVGRVPRTSTSFIKTSVCTNLSCKRDSLSRLLGETPRRCSNWPTAWSAN